LSLKPSGTSDKQNESDLPSTYIYISRPGRVRKPVCQYSHIYTVFAPVFAHPVNSRICIVHVKIAKSLEKLRW
jgi:hypothetical protein